MWNRNTESLVPAAFVAAGTNERPKFHSLSVSGLSKSYGSVKANANINISIQSGEIHAVVGQNGAGKSTFVKMLYGLQQPDQGHILLNGVVTSIGTPRDALRLGIGLIQQELVLIDELTLLENILLGSELSQFGLTSHSKQLMWAQEVQKSMGLELDWDRVTGEAPLAQKQSVEILRLLSKGVDLIIFDEPTSSLAPKQVAALLELMRSLRNQGKAVIFITHKVNEVLDVSDVISVLRDGELVSTIPNKELSAQDVANMIIGTYELSAIERTSIKFGKRALAVSHLEVRDNGGSVRVKDVSFSVCSGEVVGICGVSGNGQDEIVRATIGLMEAAKGTVSLFETDVTKLDVKDRRALGISFISPDRRREGLAIEAPIKDSAIGNHVWRLERFGWLPKKTIQTFVTNLIQNYSVKTRDETGKTSELSGGNQQKLVVGRELEQQPKLLVVAQPTRGVDLAGVAAIHDFLLASRLRDTAILLSSEDLDELFFLADRILVVFGGNIVSEFSRPFDVEAIGKAMLGVTT